MSKEDMGATEDAAWRRTVASGNTDPHSVGRSKSRPLALGVTGGIGAGKSEVLRAFERCGVPVISSDEIVHDLLRSDADVIETLRARWGERVVGANGGIDRQAVGRIVFGDRAELDFLEGVLHPRVVSRYLRWRDELAGEKEPPALCVIEIPLLYEAGSEAALDAVLVVTAPPNVRRARVDHATDEREERLLPEAEKLERADFTYENVGTLEELDAFVNDLSRELSAWSAS